MKVKLGDLTRIRTGKLDANASSEDGDYPFFTCSKDPLRISSYSYDCECVLVAGNGDLNVKYYNGKFDAYQRTYIIEDNGSNMLYLPYLYYFMDGYVEELRKLSIGGVIKYIKLGNLTDALIELPDVEKQKEIVGILGKAKSIVDAHQRELQFLDNLIKARFVEMLTNEGSTEYVRMKDVVEPNRAITYGMVKPGKDVAGGVIIIKVKDYPNGQINTDDFLHADRKLESKYARSRVKEGDLLYSIRGTVGRTAFVTAELIGANITQDTARISIDKSKYDANYVRYALGWEEVQKEIEAHIKGVAMRGISLGELREISIPNIDFEMQKQFGAFVAQVDKSRFAVQKALDKAQLLFDSLMQQYFG